MGVQLLQAVQLTPGNVLGHHWVHHPPQHLAVHAGAVAIPGGEAACKRALHGALVGVPEDVGPAAKFIWVPEAVETAGPFFNPIGGVANPGQVLVNVYSV